MPLPPRYLATKLSAPTSRQRSPTDCTMIVRLRASRQHRRGQEEPRELLKIRKSAAPTSAGVAADERFLQSIDRNARYQTREEEPGDANPDRKRARERLLRHDIAITDCEAGDEGEIDGVADRPALDKANQHAKGDLNRKNHRQDRPREAKGAAERHEKRRRTVFGVGRSMRALKSSGRLGAYDASCSVGVAFWGFL